MMPKIGCQRAETYTEALCGDFEPSFCGIES
jgi:hypothetical protein